MDDPVDIPAQDDADRQVLLFVIGLLRVALPAISLGLLVISVLGSFTRRLFARLQQSSFLENSSGYQKINDRNTNFRNAVSLPPDENGVLPVVVPVRTVRRGILYTLLTLAVLTYVGDGIVLIIHSILSGKWEPDNSENGLWNMEILYLVGSSVALATRTIAMAFEERTTGLGKFRRSAPLVTLGVFVAHETALLGILARVLATDAQRIGVSSYMGGDIPPQTPSTLGWWTITHIAIQATRILCLLLAGLMLTRVFERTQHVPNEYSALLAEEEANSRSGATTPKRNGHANGYGTFANGAAKAGAKPSGDQPSNAPIPEYKQSFWARIRILSPYLWPKKSRTLQVVAFVCFLLLGSGRVVNLLVPQMLGRLVEDLTVGRCKIIT